MKTKINFILDVIIQLLVLITTILLIISKCEVYTILFSIVVILFGIQDIEKVTKDFKEVFLNKKE